ncbi:methyltransferase domain-containing protein [Hirsutella rhossiliensis]|uniref:Methyltransferase domain-containing protein n=1 Tax=Hirsutella rhossiliensis TaxID=111463 RepID=A0A9P8MPX5_9HYPO|nr:methyltransferase domain-containing protein [Hirsutella rhossiliensis]KAH0958927.1 methyltransferase domain-containing protein [Hirsutella rhossiliensis]
MDGDDDVDDGLGASIASSSTSLASSIMRYREENGRTYHAFRAGRYVLPNDEVENERLDLQHHLCTLTLGGKLFACPAGKEKPLQRVLDAGTGTGIWAMDFADEHPGSDVTGVDLSPIQPSFVPPNVSFYIDDLEDDWTFSYKFDFIYARMLTASISDWPKFLQQGYENLNPGGWIELLDVHLQLKSDDGTIPKDCAVAKWGDYMLEAAAKLNRPLDSMTFYKQQLLDVGFTNVTQSLYKWPTNSWPKERKFKEIGIWTYENLGNGASGLSMALFTRALGWKSEEVEVFLVDVRKQMRDRSIHAYWPIYVVYAQKPEHV